MDNNLHILPDVNDVWETTCLIITNTIDNYRTIIDGDMLKGIDLVNFTGGVNASLEKRVNMLIQRAIKLNQKPKYEG